MSDIDDDVLLSCSVTKFYAPSCFWILFDKDVPKRNAYNDKLNTFGDVYTHLTDIDTNDVGKRVILRCDQQWVRGEVAQVKKDAELRKEYLCWLLDYGIFVTTMQVYKVPNDAYRKQPFVRKAMLYGMISSVRGIDYDGVHQVQEQLETEWSPGLMKLSNNIIKTYKNQKFRKLCIYEDSLIGDLFLNDADGNKNMRDLLLASNLAAYDEDIFLENLQYLKMSQKPMAIVFMQTKFLCEDDKYSTHSQIRPCGRGTFRALTKGFKEEKKKLFPVLNANLFCDAENDIPLPTRIQENSVKSQENETVHKEKLVMPRKNSTSSSDKKKIIINNESTGRGKILKELLAKRRIGSVSGDDSDSSKDDQNSVKNLEVKRDSSSNSGRGFRKAVEEVGVNIDNLKIFAEHGKRISYEDKNKKEIDSVPISDYKNFEDADSKLESPFTASVSLNTENKSLNSNPNKNSDNTEKTCPKENILVAGRGFSISKIGKNTTDNVSVAGPGFSKSIEAQSILNKDSNKVDSAENISVGGRGFSKSPISKKNDNSDKVDSTEILSVSGRGLSKSFENSVPVNTSSKGRGNLKINVGNKEVGMNLFSNLVKSSPDKLLVTAFGRGITTRTSKNNDPVSSFGPSSDSDSLKSVGRSSKSSETEMFSNAKEDQIISSGRGFGKAASVKSNLENNKLTTIDQINDKIRSLRRSFGKKSSKSDSGSDNLTNPEEEAKSIERSLKSSDTWEYESNNKCKPYKKHTLSSDDPFDDADEVSKSDDRFCKKPSVFRDSNRSVDVVNCHPAGATIKSSRPSDDPNFTVTAYQNRPPQADKGIPELLKQFGKDFKSDEKPKTNEQKQKYTAGFCQCKNCEKWRNGDNVFAPDTSEAPQPQKPKFIIKPPLLFKSDNHVDKTYKIETKRVFDTHTDKLAAPRILIHGFMQASSAPDLPHTPFNEKIQIALKKLQYSTACSIQTYTWPAILRGLSTFVVAVPNCGKTMVYVPAICNFMFCKVMELPNDNGPISIILCPRVEIAENVYRLFTNILKKSQSDTGVYCVSHLHERTVLTRLQKGVDILITTPRLLIKLLKDDTFSMNRVCHIVLEEAQDLLSLFSAEVDYILKKTQKVLENREECIQTQLIVISQEWTKPIEKLAKRLQLPPLVCIGAHLEAALYGKAEIKTQFTNAEDKPAKLIKIVENNFQHRKTIIICNDNEDSKELLQYLETNGILYKTLLFESTIEDINATKERWLTSRKGSFFVLVCTDNIFNTGLAISDAEVIIQYSFPENWSQFTFRFSGFLDSYSSPLIVKPVDMKPCTMHIMIDETNTKQFPKILNFLKRMGTQVTQSLSNFYNQLNDEIEQDKLENNVPICENLLSFGSCKSHVSCKSRHLLNSDIDVSSELPQSGIIKVKLLKIINPMQYNARIIEHIDAEGISHNYDTNFGTIVTQLLVLNDECVEMPPRRIKVGAYCAVRETDGPSKGSFQRCKILERDFENIRSRKITVYFIDIGYTQRVTASQVYFLPKCLQKIPPQCVPFYIANVGPPDFDISWPVRITTMLERDIKQAGYTDAACFFSGRIKLQLGNAIFVDDLKLQEVLHEDNFTLERLTVRNVLSKFNALEKRPNHLKNLYKLCENYKIPLQDYSLPLIKTLIKVEPQITPQWAHLENLQEFNAVFFALAHSPESFFVKLSKYTDCMEQLNKDILETMNKPFYRQVISPIEGHCYLVRDPSEETYARAIIKKLKETSAECFFVDYGDSTEVAINEIKYLPDELIRKLPFQVIECELYGVGPSNIEGKWLSESTDILYDMAYECDTDDLFRFLYVKVMGEEKSEFTGYKKYSVILCDIFEDNDVIINNLLLDKGYAFPTTEQKIEINFEELRNIISYTESVGSSDNEEQEIRQIEEQESIENEDDDEWELQLNNPEEFFKSILKLPEGNASSRNLPKIEENDSQKFGATFKALPMPPNEWSTPNVIWQQTNSHITLKVQIPDVTKYEVKVIGGRMLNFKASRGETSYKLHLNLFAKVDKNFDHSDKGLYVMIKMQKLVEAEWDRLILNKEKQRNITYNVAVILVDDDSDDEKPLPQSMIQSSKILGDQFSKDAENGPFVYEYGSDIDWDESDIESNGDSTEE